MERSIRHHFKLAVATVLMAAACLFVGFSSAAYAADAPDIDGDLSEWSAVAHQSSTDPDVSYWQIAKDADGNVYLAISGTAQSQWVDWQWSKSIGATIKGDDRQNTALAGLGGSSHRNSWDPPLIGTYKQVNDANGNNAGPMYVEVKIDKKSFDGDSNYSLKFAGTTVKASDIPSFKAASSKPSGSTSTSSSSASGSSSSSASSSSSSASSSSSSSASAKYSGITIDGNFNDWDGVKKVETQDPNKEHHQNLAAEAMVFDGDYVYLYVEEGKGGDASGAGTHSNGQFAITTDLGHELMIQLHNDHNGKSSVTAGTEEVKSKHVGRKWEIAVPKSMLPAYQKTLSFGLYQQDPTVKDVANLDASDKGNAGTFSGIVYDGDYSDWTAYPHTQIQYATAGTQEHVTDAEGALYSNGDMLYTHVKTNMPQHLQEKGSEFLWSVTYDFGDGRLLYPSYAEVDADGTIHWYSGGETLSPGKHELYIFDTSCWHNSTNINNLTSGDRNYGKITVTVDEKGKVDEMESEMDLTQVAKKFNCDAGDFKTIKAQFGRLGQEWLSCAGTSTNPLLGTGIAVGSVAAAVGGYGAYRRRKSGTAAGAAADGGATPTAQA
jgi:hypothetical protein